MDLLEKDDSSDSLEQRLTELIQSESVPRRGCGHVHYSTCAHAKKVDILDHECIERPVVVAHPRLLHAGGGPCGSTTHHLFDERADTAKVYFFSICLI